MTNVDIGLSTGRQTKIAKKNLQKRILQDLPRIYFFRIHKDIHSTGLTRICIRQDSQGCAFYRIHKDIHSTGFTRIYILPDSQGYSFHRIHKNKHSKDSQGYTF